MSKVYLVGVSMTPFGKQLDQSIKDLTALSVQAALEDAGCTPDQVQAAFFGNCVQGHLEGQTMIRGEIALGAMGLQGIPVVNVENACATGSTALHMAVSYVRAGLSDVALAVGSEKMFSPNKALTMSSFDGAWDVHATQENLSNLETLANATGAPLPTEDVRKHSVFMDIYAAMARAHMKTYGTTREDFAAVSAKNHNHSVGNALAQYRAPYSVEEVLNARTIVDPLTLPMCSPISDGSSAAIVCNDAGLRQLEVRHDPLHIKACVLRSGSSRDPFDYGQHVSRLAGDKAYRQAGIVPDDIDFAEVHDATAPGEIIEIEALRLVPPGTGGQAAASGETEIGGRLPINPSGGLECKGHPIGATGLAQVYEIALQLRGMAGDRQVHGAEIGLAQNGGGFIGVEEAISSVTIIGR